MQFPDAPNPGWLPFLKIVFGILLLIIIATLSAVIALGKVEATSSHGLDTLLGGLLTLAGAFSNWAFVSNKKPPEDKEVV